jgi:hypothetical protein
MHPTTVTLLTNRDDCGINMLHTFARPVSEQSIQHRDSVASTLCRACLWDRRSIPTPGFLAETIDVWLYAVP